ncbi:protein of unknown function [endosymbiont DhMRE of Dentiscutata heterogama]|uniref:hypothetical protein n=1 Tax=endosymbiont DhMRE of Dentiscutata heterogama TaxID=1609546 RepID=UPI000629DB9E|nr:hypothetical protein [endosymbiont DhMRE of Dentiscutata heterogama]CFW92952.1 protein of unknown function [endosymbiont DhMRE of Dentiscutata heterogama]
MNETATNYNIQELNEIFNPLDRSQGRFNKILEYVKEHAKFEYWEQSNGEERHIWLKLTFPYHPSPGRNKYHSEVYLYKKGATPMDERVEKDKGTKKLITQLAERIFNDN